MRQSKHFTKQNLLLAGSAFLIVAVGVGAWLSRSQPPVFNKVSAAAIDDTCSDSNQTTYSCYKKELTSITAKNGPEPAFALIKQQYPKLQYVKAECHQLAHVIGRAAYAKYGNITQTFAHGDQFCWAGYYHGVMEQVAAQDGTAKFLSQINTICAPIEAQAKYSFNHYNCVHGLGHGLMEALGGNLFQSLADCDLLTEDYNRTSCYGGVFMQNIMTVQSPDETIDHESAYLKPDQPMYPCTAVDTKYKQSCYLMQTSYALQTQGYDFTKVFALCAGVEPEYQQTCYQSLGRDASGQTISDAEGTKDNCLLGDNFVEQDNCIVGASKDFVSYFHSDVQAKGLCAILPVNLQTHCYITVKDYYATF